MLLLSFHRKLQLSSFSTSQYMVFRYLCSAESVKSMTWRNCFRDPLLLPKMSLLLKFHQKLEALLFLYADFVIVD